MVLNIKRILMSILFLLLCSILLGRITNDSFQTITQSNGDLDIIFSCPDYKLEKVTLNNKVYDKIVVENTEYMIEEGNPELPFFSATFAVPVNSSPTLNRVEKAKTTMLQCNTIVPCQSLEEKQTEFIINNQMYNQNSFYPETLAKVSDVQTIRDYQIINLNVFPFRYNPKLQQLEINNEIRLNIKSNANSLNPNYQVNQYISHSFEPIYENLINNFDQVRNPYALYQQPSILIIRPNNSTVATALGSLVTWKKQLGFNVTMVSTSETGTTATSIKNYIQNFYNTAVNKPEYIILVGDVTGTLLIPTNSKIYNSWSWSGTGIGDYPYTHLSGSDYLGDAFIGRLSINSTSELNVLLAKIFYYEKTPTTGGTGWFNNNLLVGDTDPSGESCVSTNRYIKDITKAYDSNHQYTELYGPQPSASSMQTTASNGCLFFNYRGYIHMSDFTTSNISALNNVRKLFYAVWITCDTGKFSSTSDGSPDCRTERAIKLGSTTNPSGAIVAIGMSTSHTLTPYNNLMAASTFNGLFTGKMVDMGQAQLFSKLKLVQVYSNFSNAAHDLAHWNNLMGDPTVRLFKTVPKNITLTAPTQISVGENSITVQAQDNNQPLSNVTVSIKASDNTCYLGTTDENGYATIIIPNDLTGSVSLTASKPDYIPTINTVTVSTVGVVGMASTSYSDQQSGNNNNQINSGEIINLSSSFKNYSSSTISNIHVVLQSMSDQVQIIDSTLTISQLLGNGTSQSSPFSFKVKENCQNNEIIGLRYKIISGGNTWYSHLSYQVYGVDANIVSYNIVGGTSTTCQIGQNNNINIKINNIGQVDLSSIQAILRPTSNYILMTDSLGSYGTVLQNSQASNTSDPFSFTVNSSVYPGMQLTADLILYNTYGTIKVIPVIFNTSTATVTNPSGPDNFGYMIFDQQDTSYPEAPVYQWEEITTVGANTGLTDSGDDGDQVTVKTLPFSFKYYGIDYNTITIGTNGWFCFGTTAQTGMRNMPLPGLNCPTSLVAVFWSDLTFNGTGAGVYTYYNSTNHSYVIQWNNAAHYQNGSYSATFTFEAILYDSQYQIGNPIDNPMKFQYKTYNQGFLGDGERPNNYFTVGVQNENATDGYTYVYNNVYPSSALAISAQKALFVTTLRNASFLSLPSSLVIREDVVKTINLRNYIIGYNSNNVYTVEASSTNHLTCTLNNLMLTITPQSNWSGTETLNITVNNQTLNKTSSGNISIQVNPINDTPIIRNPIPNIIINQNQIATLNLYNYFTDVDSIYGDHLHFSYTPVNNITISISGGIATITPNQDWSGSRSLSFSARDDSSAFVSSTAQLTVNSINNPPVISFPTLLTGSEDQILNINLANYITDPDTPFSTLTITAQNSAHLTGSITGSTLSVIPSSNWSGQEALLITVSDNQATASSRKSVAKNRLIVSDSLRIRINPINDAPVINLPVSSTLQEDGNLVINMDNYISDIDNLVSSLTISGTNTTHLNISINQHNVSITPTPNWFGTEILQLSVSDGLLSNTDEISIIVNPVNDAPTINLPATFSFDEDIVYNINLDNYINDIDNNLSSLTINANNSNHLTLGFTGHNLTITPSQNWNGTENIQFTVSDGYLSNTDIVSIVVVPVDDAPTIELPANITFNEDSSYLINMSNYISDIDSPLNSLSITVLENDHIISTINQQSVTLTPELNWNGTTNLTIQVSDGINTTNAIIQVTVNAVNDAPVLALPASYHLDEDSIFQINLSSYVSDIDTSIDQLSYIVENSQHLSVSIDQDVATITPLVNWFGNETVTFRVTDGSLFSNQQVIFTVDPINDPPILNLPNSITFIQNGSQTLNFSNYITDTDNSSFSIDYQNNVHVIPQISGMMVTFSAEENWSGEENISFTISDGEYTSTDQILVRVSFTNTAPVIELPETISFDEDHDFTLPLASYISDNETANENLTITAQNTAHLTVSRNSTEAIITPVANWYGTETLYFSVNDGIYTANDQMSVTVNPVNDLPIINIPPSFSFNEDSYLSFSLSPYISDIDNPNSSLTINCNNTEHLNITINQLNVRIDPQANWNGTESLELSVSDGTTPVNAQFNITVNPVNDAPVLNLPSSITVQEDTAQIIDFSGFISDIDNSLDQLSLIINNTNHLNVSINQFQVTITPQNNWFGTENLHVYLSDGALNTLGILPISVTMINDTPIINLPDSFTLNEDTPLSMSLDPYLSDIDNVINSLTIQGSNSEHLTISTNQRSVTITPAANWSGTEQIQLTVTDGNTSSSDFVSIIVSPVNDAPTINLPTQFTTLEDTPLTIDLSQYINDIDNNLSELSINISNSINVITQINGMSLTFTPNLNWNGNAEFTISVSDGINRSTQTSKSKTKPLNSPDRLITSDQFNLIVTSVNDAPIVNNPMIPVSFDEDTINNTINLNLVFTDPDLAFGDHLSYSVSGNDSIMVSITNGMVTLTPNHNWNGERTLVFEATDSNNINVNTSVVVTVIPVNDIPEFNLPDSYSFNEDIGGAIDLSQYINDIDNNSFNISVSGNNHISYDLSEYLLTFIPSLNWNGSEIFYISVNDQYTRASVIDSIRIIVNPINDSPVINTFSPDSTTFSINIHHSVDFQINVVDVDNDSLSYSWLINDEVLSNTENQLNYTFDTIGTYIIKVIVTDGVVSLTREWTIHILPVSNQDITIKATELTNNYPNPFNPETRIGYSLHEATNVVIDIYNIRGQLVKTLINNHQNQGQYTIVWNGRDQKGKPVSSGIYYCRMKTKSYQKIHKLMLIK